MIWALLVVGLVLLGVALLYNRLVGLRNRAREAWSDIETQLKRRHNLIPNLVETVKGYAAHERSLFEEVAEARSRALRAQRPGERGAAEGLLSQALGRLFALAEAYPDLKANQNFLELQRALQDVEDDIQKSRRYYNAVVRDYNTALESFPTVLIAQPLGFEPFEFFELEPEEAERVRRVPEVKFP